MYENGVDPHIYAFLCFFVYMQDARRDRRGLLAGDEEEPVGLAAAGVSTGATTAAASVAATALFSGFSRWCFSCWCLCPPPAANALFAESKPKGSKDASAGGSLKIRHRQEVVEAAGFGLG